MDRGLIIRYAVVSTVGTSLLSNGASADLAAVLRRTANLSRGDPVPELDLVRSRVAQVRDALGRAKDHEVRALSAELNGILGLATPPQATLHYLLSTDTYQGAATGQLVTDWLNERGYTAMNQIITGLTTATREAFAHGIDHLLEWCDQTLPPLRDQGYRVIFNLVGSFKSLQAFAQTLGMIYADEVVYIFEGPGAELIRIPRLPIAWDVGRLQASAAPIARLAAGEELPHEDVGDVPETYLEIVRVEGTDLVSLSRWGKLAWHQHKRSILGGRDADLLAQPGLLFTETFRRDFERHRDIGERTELQEALAKVSYLWRRPDGLARLRGDGGLRYSPYRGTDGIDHFRVGLALRVSCTPDGDRLRLRRFGSHDLVEPNP